MQHSQQFEHLGYARFVTYSCFERQQLLQLPTTRDQIITYLSDMRRIHNIKIFGYVLMLNHMHLVIRPPENLVLSKAIAAFKSISAKNIYADRPCEIALSTFRTVDSTGHRRIWQHKGYDHHCRDEKSMMTKINYCHHNPVKAGLVANAVDWSWSSASWYAGYKDSKLEMDEH